MIGSVVAIGVSFNWLLAQDVSESTGRLAAAAAPDGPGPATRGATDAVESRLASLLLESLSSTDGWQATIEETMVQSGDQGSTTTASIMRYGSAAIIRYPESGRLVYVDEQRHTTRSGSDVVTSSRGAPTLWTVHLLAASPTLLRQAGLPPQDRWLEVVELEHSPDLVEFRVRGEPPPAAGAPFQEWSFQFARCEGRWGLAGTRWQQWYEEPSGRRDSLDVRSRVDAWQRTESGACVPLTLERTAKLVHPVSPVDGGQRAKITTLRSLDDAAFLAARDEILKPRLGDSVVDERFDCRYRVGDRQIVVAGVVIELKDPISEIPEEGLEALLKELEGASGHPTQTEPSDRSPHPTGGG